MSSNNKSKMASKKMKNDFMLTIESDYDSEVEIENHSKTSSSQADSKKGSTKSKSKKSDSIEISDNEADMNPEFSFSLEGSEVMANLDGWDFNVSKNDESSKPRTVDLNKILKSKGGLTNIVGAESDSDEGECSDEGVSEENDDELAIDGFGGKVNEFKEESESDEESGREEGEEIESGNEASKGEGVNSRMEKEENIDEMSSDSDSQDEEEAEQEKEFYADEAESKTVKEFMYQDFQSLQLSRPLLKGLAKLGYLKPSPIQSAAIPIGLMGKDIVAGAVTGSGKTAAFMIPIIERLIFKSSKSSSTRVIILEPTRELAIQVYDVGKKIGAFVSGLSFGLAVGGLNLRQQEQQLKERPDIVIATPGRLIDHIRNSPSFSVDSLEILVMDEADRMLDEGFKAELTEILTLIPKYKRQTMLFSATMNTKIQDLIQLSLNKPVKIMINPPKQAASNLTQEFVRIRDRQKLKPAVLFGLLRSIDPLQSNRTVIFVSRKDEAHKLRIILGLLGLKVTELHGSLTQEQRLINVNQFKSLEVPVLICTDLAARGLDIPKIEYVINYDMPKTHEIYLHRVGRTARAGRQGLSISLVGDSLQERRIVKEVLKSVKEDPTKSKTCVKSRMVDWKKADEYQRIIESKKEIIDEIEEEEKREKEIIQAEMELNKASNLIEHRKEIQSRPKRTWFESNEDSKSANDLPKKNKPLNSKRRKAMESKQDSGVVYKKTKADRMADYKKNNKKSSKKKKGRK